MKKGIWIAGIVVLVLGVGVYLYRWYAADNCPPPRNPQKFPEPWLENSIPHGDLGRLAEQYANPVLGEDSQKNGSLVGGFFKGIDVYPSTAAAKYYRSYLTKYLKSAQALPYWNMTVGELHCQNKS